MAVVELTKENFEQVVTSNPTVIVDYWAPWCGPCRGFAPVFERVAEANPDVVFAKVNTDDEQEIAAHFQIRSIPTLMVFREQIIVFSQPGRAAAERLRAGGGQGEDARHGRGAQADRPAGDAGRHRPHGVTRPRGGLKCLPWINPYRRCAHDCARTIFVTNPRPLARTVGGGAPRARRRAPRPGARPRARRERARAPEGRRGHAVVPARVRPFVAGRRAAHVRGRGAAAHSRRRHRRQADPRQAFAGRLGAARRAQQLAARERRHVGNDAHGQAREPRRGRARATRAHGSDASRRAPANPWCAWRCARA